MPEVFAAITCDIMKSRRLAHRQEIQNSVKSAIDAINLSYADAIASPFRITLGDEWQGLIKRPHLSYRIIHSFGRLLGDIRFYAGIGIGGITTEIAPVLEMDGPAFHRARSALEKAKAVHSPVVFSMGEPRQDRCLNAFAAIIEGTKRRCTRRQAQIIEAYEKLQNMEETGNALGISKQAVSKILKAAMWRETQDALEQMEFLIDLFVSCDMQGGHRI